MRMLPLVMGIKLNNWMSTVMRISFLGWFLYFYLGYMIVNGLKENRISTIKLLILITLSVMVQMAEGYWYYLLGDQNCGTQLKLSALLTGLLFVLLAERYITTDNSVTSALLRKVGDNSFGVFFSHLAVMRVMNKLPYYEKIAFFPA